MSKKSANINKRKSGVNTLGGIDVAENSEPDSELLKKKIEELNDKFKERSIKARILSKQNYLYIRGTFTDSKGARKDRKIPLRLSADISNLVSAEARILQLMEYIKKNGFIPEELLWDAPKVEISGGGITVAEGISKLEIEYWKDKDRNKEMVAWLLTQYQRLAVKSEADKQYGVSLGCYKEIANLVIKPNQVSKRRKTF